MNKRGASKNTWINTKQRFFRNQNGMCYFILKEEKGIRFIKKQAVKTASPQCRTSTLA